VKIGAQVRNGRGQNIVELTTDGRAHSIEIPPGASGVGSSANGGELLFLALATCYCNDIYREARKRGIRVEQVEVEVEGEFAAEGWPASNITYNAKVTAEAGEAEIRDLMQHTDRIAEIQNTLRAPTPVTLSSMEAISTQ
jgi:organic hydroperoxide reductase OsmC/OhrA